MPGKKKNIPKRESRPQGIPIPAGTEQETGFTRAETEKVTGPVKLQLIIKEKRDKKKNK